MKISKKILAIALSVLMLISVMPFAAFAATTNVTVETFAELKQAVADYNAAEGAAYYSVKIAADIELTETLTIDSASTSSFYLNSSGAKKTITLADGMGSAFYVKHGRLSVGTLTLTGAPSNYKMIWLTGSQDPEAPTSYSYVSTSSNTTINCTNGYAIMISYPDANHKHAYGAKINIGGGNIFGFYGAAYVNGSLQDTEGTVPAINVSAGSTLGCNEDITIEDGSSAIYAAGYANYTISGGTLNGASGMYAKAGNVVITGGTFNGKGDARTYIEDHNGNKPTGEAIVLENNTGYAPLTVSITGGTFNSINAEPVGAYCNPAADAAPSAFIDGGKFLKNGVETQVPEAYLAEGASYQTYDGVTGLFTSLDKVRIGAKGYQTLQHAVGGASNGDTIVIMDDVTENDAFVRAYGDKNSSPKAITIDLAGHTVTGTYGDDAGHPTMCVGYNNIHFGSVHFINSSTKLAKYIVPGGISVAASGATLEVDKNIEIACPNSSYAVMIDKNVANANVIINGKVTSTFAEGSGLYVNGSAGTGNVVTVAGTVNVPCTGIYAAGNATYNIAGSITAGTGIYQKGGNLAITKGTITANGAKADYVANGNGFTPTGDALAIEKASGYTLGTVAISGTATLKSTNNKALAVYPADADVDVSLAAGTTYKIGNDKDDVSAYYDTTALVQDDNGKLIVKDTIAAEVTDAQTGKVTYITSTTGQLQIKAQTVKLLKDFNATNFITHLFAGQDAVLDLNGHTFTSTATNRSGFVVRANTKLVIKNSAENEAYINIPVDADVQGELVLEDGVTLNGNIAYFGSATVTIDGTVIGSDDTFAISSNNIQASGTTLNITKNAVITSEDGIAIYHPEAGTVNISGGTITGKTALYAKRGDINISGGTFYGTGEDTGYVASGNGADATGDAVVFDNMKGYAGTLSATITGGKFVSENAKAVASYATDLTPISGFVAASDAVFSSDVSEFLADTENFECVYDDAKGGYIIKLIEKEVPQATDGAELEVSENIALNTYIDADEYVDAYSLDPQQAVLKVTYNKNTDINRVPVYTTDVIYLAATDTVDESEVNNIAFANTYKYSQQVAPAQLTEDIVFALYASENDTIPVVEIKYSVYDLCMRAIELNAQGAEGYSDNLAAFCQATIDYAKASQTFFGYRAADLADVEYSEAKIEAIRTVNALDAEFGKPGIAIPTDFGLSGVSFTVKSQVELNIFTDKKITVSSVSDGANAGIKDVGTDKAFVIDGILAQNTLNSITAQTELGPVTISAINIVRSAIHKNPTEDNLLSLAVALLFYGRAAATYAAAPNA